MARLLRWLGACVAAVSLLVMLSAAAASADELSPALKALIAEAQKEGKLELQWGAGTIGDSAHVKAMGDAMNKMFGTTIAVRFTPGPSQPEVLNAIMVTQSAHSPSPTDVFIGDTEYAANLYTQKGLVPVDWVALLPERIQPQSVEGEGTVLRIFTSQPGGIVYNTQLAPEKPASLTDLLKPEWKGKIASTPYAAGWSELSSSDVWGMERALGFAEALSPQLAGLIRCNDLSRVASGEFIAFGPNCGGRDWLVAQKAGAPIGYVVPKDYAAELYYYAALPKNAADAAAAKLFIAFLETTEGQKMIWQPTLTDLDTYPDSQFAKVIEGYEKTGIKFYHFSVTWYVQHPEGEEGVKKAITLLRGH